MIHVGLLRFIAMRQTQVLPMLLILLIFTVLAFAYVSQDASLQPIGQCSAATNVHHLHPCHVPNQYLVSCLHHKIGHK